MVEPLAGGSALKIRVLGPVEATRDGGPLDLGGPMPRRLLAVLAAHHDEVVSVDRLCDALWGDVLPLTATRTLQSHLSRLRRLLEPEVTVAALSPGYRLHAHDGVVDSVHFEQSLAVVPQRPARARARALSQALGVFHGRPFDEFADEEWARPAVTRLDELRLQALGDWVAASLDNGEAPRMVVELEQLILENPLHERFWCQLMLSLYLCGRQAEAVARGVELRRVYRDELGLDPSPDAIRLEDQILRGDPDLGRSSDVAIALDPIEMPSFLDRANATVIGRVEQVERIVNFFREASAGAGATVIVEGEAGIGKTRVAAEVARRTAADGAVVLGAQCDQFTHAPFEPWVEALRPLGADRGDDVVAPRVAQLIDLLSPKSRHVDATRGPVRMDEETDRRVVFDAIARLLRDLSAVAPLLFVVDDLQWADESSLLLLHHLARKLQSTPVLLVATVRAPERDLPEPVLDLLAELDRCPTTHLVKLDALDAAATTALVDALAGPVLPPNVESDIYEITRGNPFFVHQVVAHLLETGATKLDDDEELDLPDGVRRMVAVRLSRLDHESRSVLAVAAVVGRRFGLSLVTRAAGCEHDRALELLDHVLATGLAIASPDGSNEFEFAHPLVRATVLDELTPLRRSILHRRVAEAIEEVSGDDVTADLSALTHHWSRAARYGSSEPVLRYALLAAEAAADAYAWEETVRHCHTVLSLLEPDGEPERRWHALYLLARANTALGHHRVALEAVLRACDVARGDDAAELFGRVVLLLDPRNHIATGTNEVANLQAEALERLSGSVSIERPLLLAASIAYAVESGSSSVTLEEITDHEDEAIAIADATSDLWAQIGVRATLARARAGLPGASRQLELAAAVEQRVLAPTADSQRRISDSMVSAYRDTAIASQAEAHAKLANRANFDACLERRSVSAQRALSNMDRGWESFISGLQPFIDGNLDDAEALTLAAQRVGSTGPSLAAAIFDRLTRIAWLRRDDEAVDERLRQAAPFEDAYPQVRAMRAMVAAERGSQAEARSLARQLLRDGGTQLPWNGGRPRILHDLAVVAAHTHDTAIAELLHSLLRPYVGEMLTSYLISVEGAAATSVAIVEFVLGRMQEARLQLQAGLALEERFGATLAAAATRAWRAQLTGAV